ncbi:thiamine pyrophosphate-dependent enzyme [Bradyrhizobium sp. LA6.12]|uniref:thiamine pyrophosphate-dependent enzyme n=1 Tax=unclassified Bradyrhizobium TaxID=2631580 RepID=UPI003396099A
MKFGAYTTACHFAPVDHVAIARACGSVGTRVETPAEILPALRDALQGERSTLVEITTDPDAHPAISLYDGTLDPAVALELELV